MTEPKANRIKPILIWLALSLASCRSSTEFGRCIGAFDDPDPALRYSTSGWNVAMGIIFIETIVAPIVVIANETRCPVARKDAPKEPEKSIP